MSDNMHTHWFNLLWQDGSGSERFCVVLAPDRDTALQLAAMEIINDEGLEPAYMKGEANNLLDWIERNFEVLSEGEDIATACPNCTSHNTRRPNCDTEVWSCHSCGFDFIPLGMGVQRIELERAARSAIREIPAFDEEFFGTTA